MILITLANSSPLTDTIRWWDSLAQASQRNIVAGGIVVLSIVLAKIAGQAVRTTLVQKGFDLFPIKPYVPPPQVSRGFSSEPQTRKFTVCDALGWTASALSIIAGCWLAARHTHEVALADSIFRLGQGIFAITIVTTTGAMLAAWMSAVVSDAYARSNIDESIAQILSAREQQAARIFLSPVISLLSYSFALLFVAIVLADQYGLQETARLVNEVALLIPRFLTAILVFGLCWFALRVGPRMIATSQAEATGDADNTSQTITSSIIYVFSVIAAGLALLGVRSIVPDWSAVILILLIACALAFRGTIREVLTGLYFHTKNFTGRKVRIGDLEATIERHDLFHTWMKENGKEHVRPNSEVFAALKTSEYEEPVEIRTDANAKG